MAPGQARSSAATPIARSALIPLLHLAQEQDGYVAEDAMEHIAELIGCTPAEVYGTGSFYEMFKFHPVGKYVDRRVHQHLLPAPGRPTRSLEHAERALGVRPGGTTDDGMFTLEDVECIAACTLAPCLQVNYRYFPNVDRRSLRRAWSPTCGPAPCDDTVPAPRRPGPHPPARRRRAVGPASGTAAPLTARGRTGPVPPCRSETTRMTYTPVEPIVTARLAAHDDAHTLQRAVDHRRATRRLRKALGQTPEEVHETVKVAVLQGRGGAGFPAGQQVGAAARAASSPAGSWSTATRASPGPTRTASSWSAIRTS